MMYLSTGVSHSRQLLTADLARSWPCDGVAARRDQVVHGRDQYKLSLLVAVAARWKSAQVARFAGAAMPILVSAPNLGDSRVGRPAGLSEQRAIACNICSSEE